jgi:ATP-dependent Zn protease
VSNYDIYSLPLRTFVADILVSMAGHVATKLFLGEYWTGATGDFQNVRSRLWQLSHYGYFGPPLDMQQIQPGMLSLAKDRTGLVEKFWRKLEDQTEQILLQHSAEVHAVAQALLDRNDLTGKQCIEVIRAAATNEEAFDSELLLKSLVEETMVNGKNGKSEKKPPTKRKTTPKVKAKTE